jgi:hypothetical protein
VLKDDWQIFDEIGSEILYHSNASGYRQVFKQCLETSLANSKFTTRTFEYRSRTLKIFSIEIEEVCTDMPAQGVLFVITSMTSDPDDIAQVLRLFSKIASNLLSRQGECVVSQVERRNQAYTARVRREAVPVEDPSEVVALREQPESSNMEE